MGTCPYGSGTPAVALIGLTWEKDILRGAGWAVNSHLVKLGCAVLELSCISSRFWVYKSIIKQEKTVKDEVLYELLSESYYK